MVSEKDRLDTRNHVIIWQPGSLGKSAMIFDNEHLGKLADYLEPAYGPEYPIIAYLAAMRPLQKPKIEKIAIKDLRNSEVVKKVMINPCTTFYLPPKTLPPIVREIPGWDDYPNFSEGQKGEKPIIQCLLPTSAYRISHPEMMVASPSVVLR